MLGLKPSLVELDSCKPKDLIRISLDGSARWVLCGYRKDSFFNVVVLDDPDGPTMIDVGGTFGINNKYDNLTVLNYGASYDFEIVHTSPCQLDAGAPLFSVPGVGVMVDAEFGIGVRIVGQDQIGYGYFIPATGIHSSKDRGGRKAAFAHWRLLMLKKEPPHELIFESNVQLPSN
jgi:hypothetical protein